MSNFSDIAHVAKHVSGVIDTWARPDHVLLAANEKGIKAITKAVGHESVNPVPAEDLPRLADVDWSALKGEKGEARTYRIGQLDARQRKALAAAAEGDHRAVA